MYTPNNPEDTRQVQACKMRAEGQTIRSVAEHFGVGCTAVRRWTDPEARRKRNEYRRHAEGGDYRRNENLRLKYGITLEEYNQMLEEQGNCCAICKQPSKPDLNMPVDHCHTTGKVRQILCTTCNAGIGMLKEDPEILRAAIDYLEKHN